jgi:hypothetical protein
MGRVGIEALYKLVDGRTFRQGTSMGPSCHEPIYVDWIPSYRIDRTVLSGKPSGTDIGGWVRLIGRPAGKTLP